MSGFYGANTDHLRQHGQLMVTKAQRVIELRDQLTPLVMDEGIWRGSDADSFRSEWSGHVAGLFEGGQQTVNHGGKSLEEHAEEQDQASADGEGGAGGSGGGEDGGWNPFGFLKDLWVKGQGLFKKFKDFMKFVDAIPTAFDEFRKLADAGLEKLWRSAYLDELFKGGKGWQAAAEKLFDKLKIPNSLGNLRPLEWLNKLDDVAPWLKSVGSGLGKAMPFVDIALGGLQAYNGFKDGDIYSGVSGSLSAIGGGLLVAAPFTGPAAPIVGAVGAGLGIVSAGMDIGRMVYDNWDGITSTVGNAASTVGNAVGSAASAAGDAIGSAASSVGSAISDAGSAVSDALGGLGNAFGW